MLLTIEEMTDQKCRQRKSLNAFSEVSVSTDLGALLVSPGPFPARKLLLSQPPSGDTADCPCSNAILPSGRKERVEFPSLCPSRSSLLSSDSTLAELVGTVLCQMMSLRKWIPVAVILAALRAVHCEQIFEMLKD